MLTEHAKKLPEFIQPNVAMRKFLYMLINLATNAAEKHILAYRTRKLEMTWQTLKIDNIHRMSTTSFHHGQKTAETLGCPRGSMNN